MRPVEFRVCIRSHTDVIAMAGKRLYILANTDGPEGQCSEESARDVQLRTGGRVIDLRAGAWAEQLESATHGTDALFFMATHGGFGEDGTLHAFLESRGFAHTHSRGWACAIMSHKHHAKTLYASLGLRTPTWVFAGDFFGANASGNGNEWLRKPLFGGSKAGISICPQVADRRDANAIYERYIAGSLEVSVCTVNLGSAVALPPLIRSRCRESIGFLYETNETLPVHVLEECSRAALTVHRTLRIQGVAKTDFVIDEQNVPHVLETDAHPGLGEARAVARVAAMHGIHYESLLEAIICDC